jgi:hypothetical protein
VKRLIALVSSKIDTPAGLSAICLEMLSFMRSVFLRPATSLTGSFALQPAPVQSSSPLPFFSPLPFVRFATKKAAGSSKNGHIIFFYFTAVFFC